MRTANLLDKFLCRALRGWTVGAAIQITDCCNLRVRFRHRDSLPSMGSTKKVPSEKKKEGLDSSEVAKPRRVSGKAFKENEIDSIFGKKKRNLVTETHEILAEDDGMGRTSTQKKKKVKKTTSSVDEDGKVKAGNQSKGDGKARKSLSSAEPGLSKPRKKTADGLTVYGEDELKWNTKDAGGTPLCPFDCDCCY